MRFRLFSGIAIAGFLSLAGATHAALSTDDDPQGAIDNKAFVPYCQTWEIAEETRKPKDSTARHVWEGAAAEGIIAWLNDFGEPSVPPIAGDRVVAYELPRDADDDGGYVADYVLLVGYS